MHEAPDGFDLAADSRSRRRFELGLAKSLRVEATQYSQQLGPAGIDRQRRLRRTELFRGQRLGLNIEAARDELPEESGGLVGGVARALRRIGSEFFACLG